MMSLQISTDIDNRLCTRVDRNEHRPSVKTSLTSDLEQLTKSSGWVVNEKKWDTPKHLPSCEEPLSDSALVISDDGCEDAVELASEDELIALLSSTKRCFSGAQRRCSQHPHQEPAVPSPKTLVQSVCEFSSPKKEEKIDTLKNFVVPRALNYHSITPNYYDHYSGAYSHGAPVFLHAQDARTRRAESNSPVSQACFSHSSRLEPYQILARILSKPQETHLYYPTSEMHGSERRASEVEFEKKLNETSERLGELYKEEPTVLATNPGSANHHLMTCKPCVFNQKASGCNEADNCNHCHRCSKDIFRLKEATKVKIGRRIRKLSGRGNSEAEVNNLHEWMVTLGLQRTDTIVEEMNQA